MNPPAAPSPRRDGSPVGPGLLLLSALIALAWANSLGGPFVFDDLPSLVDNPSLRHFATALLPPAGGLTVSGRPWLNLTFALNHAWSGEAVGSYHVLNLVIHGLTALLLFGLTRRTLRSAPVAGRFGASADGLALAAASLWAVHPLQTESVTYVVQRAESLAGLFYAGTLYAFCRSAASARPARWLAVSVASCLLGMLSKETVATAPLLVVLYDRTFVSGSFRAAWARHRGYFTALAATWLVLGGLVLATGNRGGSAGYDTPASPGAYALIQLQAVPHYLRLCFWPDPLVIDYGPFQSAPLGPALIGGLVVVPLLGLTFWALVRRPAAGFLGAWFWLMLAPSSSIVPVASQVMAEHRIYLALFAVGLGVVLALHCGFGRRSRWVVALLVAAAGVRTARRNLDYRSALALWTATARDCPDNPRALLNLGQALSATGRWADAAREFEAALRLQPDYVAAHLDLGLACMQRHLPAEAERHFSAALRLNPTLVEAAYGSGNALAELGRPADAVARYRAALRLDPRHARAHYNLGNALVELGRLPEAIAHYRASLRLDPDHADAHFNLGNALAQTGRYAEAAAEYEAVLRRAPHDAEAAQNLAAVRQALAGAAPP